MFDNRIKLLNKFLSWINGDDYYVHKVNSFDRSSIPVVNEIIIVGGKGYCKWVYIACPCGCGEVLNLSLMKSHEPHWNLKIDNQSRPSLYPSVWKKDGCNSHFWIKEGKIVWCDLTDISPSD